MPAAGKSRARADAKKTAATRLHARLFGALAQRPIESFGAAVFAALMTGVLLNALALQNARHPSPLFGTPIRLTQSPPIDAPKPVPRPVALTASPSVPPPVAIPTRPVALPQEAEPHSAKASDPIGQIIRNTSQNSASAPSAPSAIDATRILLVQKALVKLGYVLRADGVIGATTRQAIEKFERERGWPAHGELTPRVVREIAARSGLPIE
jgi:Putative peptidoglycan binding domain